MVVVVVNQSFIYEKRERYANNQKEKKRIWAWTKIWNKIPPGLQFFLELFHTITWHCRHTDHLLDEQHDNGHWIYTHQEVQYRHGWRDRPLELSRYWLFFWILGFCACHEAEGKSKWYKIDFAATKQTKQKWKLENVPDLLIIFFCKVSMFPF